MPVIEHNFYSYDMLNSVSYEEHTQEVHPHIVLGHINGKYFYIDFATAKEAEASFYFVVRILRQAGSLTRQ